VWTNKLVGGESVEQVGERADKMIARSLAAVATGPNAGQSTQVALFAHAHILRILGVRWIGLPPVDGKLFALGTGSVSVLGFEREQRVISRWNRSFEE
jgi:probable phosphoglycerate mutase